MPIEPLHKSTPKLVDLDWFAPAIKSEGSVYETLNVLDENLNSKLNFVRHLREQIQPNPSQVDKVTNLLSRAKQLEKTLSYRLGLLTAARPQAWFRQFVFAKSAPFAKGVLSLPVFSHYEVAELPQLKEQLKTAFNGQIPSQDLPLQACLWTYLIALNQDLLKLSFIQIENFRLDISSAEWETNIPDSITSPLLLGFLNNVSESLMHSKNILQQCFQKLWLASSQLWQAQLQEKEPQRQESYKSNDHNSNVYTESARKQRAAFSQHRHTQAQAKQNEASQIDSSVLTEYAALRYLGFQSYPELTILKKRYLTLAKKTHPDRAPDQVETFKKLSACYNLLKDSVFIRPKQN
ncbi:MAG: J domain-containing protein [Oligoflexales bacterium]|nr:J domain-containing protein [Oligoflexales bacterium]